MKKIYSYQLVILRLSLVLVLVSASAIAQAASTSAQISTSTTAFLKRFVNKAGEVNYGAIQRDPQQLDDLLQDIASYDTKAWASQADLYAFYLNAYNVLVIGEIVANYPLTSVQQMPGFFDKKQMLVAGEKMTLDQLEHNKLRKLYDDPRLHFVLVCGTTSCPRLSREAYTGKELFVQLNTQTQRVLQDPAFVQVDAVAKTVKLPEIFKWYEAEFSSKGKTGLAYINQYRSENSVPASFSTDYYSYDWRLNDQKK
ncbi:DUF547 domain-containing protein [Hymenobacter sp. BT186]|uniref:DUF547 domain-containing protein n=1 Tax=Hymenobacter telluris TaxID=2816474 RepID=A0A939EZD4_9BACT|nr:DUF547 domain-containing protein [Hymenobacter telluris]MBO0360300.1 DUF547 domain-containing protein [Hymenobacter telluris]MBW3376327.1 DUF547 domain-containing protein [Hymenobacter norwichensis]